MRRTELLKLRSIGTRDFSIFEGRQRIGRIRFAEELSPGVWMWSVVVHLPSSGSVPVGSAEDIETAKAEFKSAWQALKARTTPEELVKAYRAMNIRDETR